MYRCTLKYTFSCFGAPKKKEILRTQQKNQNGNLTINIFHSTTSMKLRGVTNNAIYAGLPFFLYFNNQLSNKINSFTLEMHMSEYGVTNAYYTVLILGRNRTCNEKPLENISHSVFLFVFISYYLRTYILLLVYLSFVLYDLCNNFTTTLLYSVRIYCTFVFGNSCPRNLIFKFLIEYCKVLYGTFFFLPYGTHRFQIPIRVKTNFPQNYRTVLYIVTGTVRYHTIDIF